MLNINYPINLRGRKRIESFAINKVSIKGQWLEFGVASGESINFIARKTKNIIYGFDSFIGLPEPWRGISGIKYSIGAFKQKKIPKVESNVHLIIGLFQKTLPNFKKEQIAFLHLDADLYSSTSFVLNELNNYIVKETIIIFDEYFSPEHEEKATKEWVKFYNRKLLFLAKNNQQLVVKVQ